MKKIVEQSQQIIHSIKNQLNQIQLLISNSQYKQSINLIDKLIQKIGQKSGLIKLKAKIMLKLNCVEEANLLYKNLYSKFNKSNSLSSEIVKEAIHTSFQLKNYECIKQYANSIKDQYIKQLIIGDCCFLQQNYIAALIYYEKITNLKKQNEQGRARKAAILIKQCKYDKAKQILDDLLKKNDNNFYYGERAFVNIKSGKIEEGIKDLEKSIQLKQNKIFELNYIITILDKYDKKALQLIKKLSENIQKNQEHILLTLISIYQYKNNYTEAHQLCTKYQKNFTTSKYFMLKYSIIKFLIKPPQIQNALAILSQLFLKYPNDIFIVVNYCKFFGKYKDDAAKTLVPIMNKYEQQVNSKSDQFQSEYYNTLGFLFSKINQNKKAIQNYNKAIKLIELKSIYRYNLSVLLLRENRLDQSRYQISRSINMNDNNDNNKYRKLQQTINNLEASIRLETSNRSTV